MSETRQRRLAVLWWLSCTLWAYFTFGELVVAADYPEVFAVIGVGAGFAVAGRRVRALLRSPKAVAVSAVIVLALSGAAGVLVPGLLATVIQERSIALLCLVSSIAAAFLTLRFIRRFELAGSPETGRPASPIGSIVTWVLVLIFSVVALTFAASDQ